MGGNIIFGFIDNAGLFFGGCYLDEVFALLPGAEDANVKKINNYRFFIKFKLKIGLSWLW